MAVIFVAVIAAVVVGRSARAAEPAAESSEVLEEFKVAADGTSLLVPVTIGEHDYLFVVDTGSHDDVLPDLLGLGFLLRHRVTFDFPSGCMYLKPARQAERYAEGDLGGLSLTRGEGGVTVSAVSFFSPAAIADLRVGDVLKELNGEDIAQMRFGSIQRTFSEYGANIRLRILRGAKSLEASLALPAKQPETRQIGVQ